MYRHAHHFFTNLRASRADAFYEKTLARISKQDLLIIDDPGLHQLPKEQVTRLYELIALRYEKAATVITSNRRIPVRPWIGCFIIQISLSWRAIPTGIYQSKNVDSETKLAKDKLSTHGHLGRFRRAEENQRTRQKSHALNPKH